MNSLSKKKKDRSPGALGAMGTGILIGSITPFILVISAVIVANTGIWWFPLLFGFLTVIGTPVFALFQRREKSSYHMLVGHEIYYSDNPGELKKALKKARKKGIPDGVRRKATYYRSRHDKVTPFTDIREQKRRRKAALLYMSAGITALLGVFMIWRAFPFPKDLLKDGLKTADFTSIFLIAGGIMAIITAVGLCLRKPVGVCRYIAGFMQVMSIWSAYVSYTLEKRPSSMDYVINAVCLAVLFIFSFIVPAIAGDTRTAEQMYHDRKELKIDLFEMGYIGENELREI